MKKPWLKSDDGRSLEAYIGAYKIKTSQFRSTESLISAAKTLFELTTDSSSIEDVAAEIRDLPKKHRSKLANKNRGKIGVPPTNKQVKPVRSEAAKNSAGSERRAFTAFQYRLSEKNRFELTAWLPRLRDLHQRAVSNNAPWAKCYQNEIRMIETGLEDGKL